MSEEAKRQISYQPTDGLSYDPSESKYWDEDALGKEIERVFEVCHGCRMCFKYCDSFPILFSAIDDEHDGDVRKVTPLDTERVMDACFQCKLCEVQCPYTPRDGHEFQLDFPKLVHRYDAIRYRKHQQPHKLRLKVLEDPDRASAMARASFGMANVMNRVGIHRWFMEKLVGIDRRKLLPDFAQTTFESWAKGAGLMDKGVGGEAVLFQTCYVQGNEPQIGMDTVEVLEKNGVDVRCEKGLECCGMPAWEGGNLELLRKKAHANLGPPDAVRGSRRKGDRPQSDLLDDAPSRIPRAARRRRSRARQDAAAAVADPSEFVWSLRREERFNTDFKSTPGNKVAYHAPCHLRTQGVGFKGRDLLAQDSRGHPGHRHGMLWPRRHARDDGRRVRVLDSCRAESIRGDEGGGRGDLGDRLPSRSDSVPAARGRETLASHVDSGAGLSQGWIRGAQGITLRQIA